MASNVSNDVSNDVLVWLEDEKEMIVNLPAVYFSLTLMTIGLIGNGFVVYAYGFRFRRTCANIYTYWLGVFDICCCAISIPFEVFQIRYPLMFGEPISCKCFRTISLVLYLSEGFMLLCIALDRYMKICQPIKSSVRKSPRMHVLYTVLLATMLAWPAAFVYGRSSVQTSYPGVFGSTCSIDNALKDSIFPGLFYGLLLTVAVGGFIALVVFYSSILRVVRHWKTHTVGEACSRDSSRSISSISSRISNFDNRETTVSYVPSANDDQVIIEIDSSNLQSGFNPSNHNTVTSGKVDCDRGHQVTLTRRNYSSASLTDIEHVGKSTGCRNHAAQDVQGRLKTQAQIAKTTIIFFVVSFTFVLSYMPYLTAEILLKTNAIVFKEQHFRVQQFLEIVAKTYCINNASNPIIYSIFNASFRKECLALFKRTSGKSGDVHKVIVNTKSLSKSG